MSTNYSKTSVLRREDSYGEILDTANAFLLRRNSVDVSRNIDQKKSNTITPYLQSNQIYDGNESVSISLNTELSPVIYSELIKGYTGRVFTKRASIILTDLSIVDDAPNYILVGTDINLEVKIGDIVRLDGLAINSNNKTNLVVLAIGTDSLNVSVINNKPLVLQSGINAELIFSGSKTFINTTNTEKTTFTLENYSDGLSEVYSGLIPTELSISASPNQMCNFDISFTTQKLKSKGTSRVLPITVDKETNPVDVHYAALYIDGVRCYVSSFDINSSRDISTKEDILTTTITGFDSREYSTDISITVQLKDWSFASLLNTKVSLVLIIPSNSSDLSEYVGIVIPSAKVTSVNHDDGGTIFSKLQLKATLEDKPNFNYSTFIYYDSSSAVLNWEDLDTWNDDSIWYD